MNYRMIGKRINKYVSILLASAMVFAMAAPTGVWAEYDQQASNTEYEEQTVTDAVYDKVTPAMLRMEALAPMADTSDEDIVQAAYDAIAEADYTNLEVADLDDEWQKNAAVKSKACKAANEVVAGLGVTIDVVYYGGPEYYVQIVKNGAYSEYAVEGASFIIIPGVDADTCAISFAKIIIASIDYTALGVVDDTNQVQKTAAVQDAVDMGLEGSGVTAAVNFVEPNYLVTLLKNEANDSYPITSATFIESDYGSVLAVYNAIKAADIDNQFEALKVGDAANSTQTSKAVKLVARAIAEAAVPGFGEYTGVYLDGSDYIVEIDYNSSYKEHTIVTVSFDPSDGSAVELAGAVIAAADFTYLDVGDASNQEQKTSVVQLKVDEELNEFDVTAAVTYASPNYVVAISKNTASASYTIPAEAVSFAETDFGAVSAAKAVIGLADYTVLEVADLHSGSSNWQMEQAVRAVAKAAAEAAAGQGLDIYVSSGGGSFFIDIRKNDASDSIEISIPSANFSETDAGAVNMAKAAIEQASNYDEFRYLEVGDITNQAQKNATVQIKTDAAVAEFEVTAVVGYDAPYYAVELYKNEAFGSYYIDNATFVPYAPLAVTAAKDAIAAADYTDIPLLKVVDQSQKTDAVQQMVGALTEGLGVGTSVTFVSPNYNVVIFKDATEDYYTITTATFMQSDPLVMIEVKAAIEAADYTNLAVDDSTVQWKKTASVQDAANRAAKTIWALGDIEATVTFSANNYIVAINVNGISDSYTIQGNDVTFTESGAGALIAARYAVAAIDYTNISVTDIVTDAAGIAAAVQTAVDAVLENAVLKHPGVTATAAPDGGWCKVSFFMDGVIAAQYAYYVGLNEIVLKLTDDAKAVEEAKTTIIEESYVDLGVASLGNQDQNTAAVQAAVDHALSGILGLSGVSALVTFDTPDYTVAISKNGASDNYTITPDKVSFIITDSAILSKVNNAVSAANYTDLEVLDVTNKLQKKAAIQLVAEAAVEAVLGEKDFSVEVELINNETEYVVLIYCNAGFTGSFLDTTTFVESEASVVKVAKGVIAAGSYENLEVGDIAVQEQKTAAVQIAVQAALATVSELNAVTATVSFDGTYYAVAISKNGIDDNYAIAKSTFIATDTGAVKLAKATIAAVDYTNLEVADMTNQPQKTAAVQGMVDAAIDGLGVTATITYDSGYYKAAIAKNAVHENYYITTATFIPTADNAVSSANIAVSEASYSNLAVMDINNQTQKTAAVQSVVNAAIEGFGVTAAVTYAAPNYSVTISKDDEEQNYTITTATFIQSTQLALMAVKEVVAAANYTNLQIGDKTNQVQKMAAVQGVVNAAVEGFGVTAAVAFVSPNYVVTISKGTAKSIYTITGATFNPTNTYAVTTAPIAGGTATVTASHGVAYAGDTITVNISGIQAEKRFLSISVNGGAVPITLVSAGAHYTFTMPEGVATVTVTLESIPWHALSVTDNNILIVGRHAFNLDAAVQAGLATEKKYNLTNFTAAMNNWVYQPTAGVKAVYYRAGDKWYNLTTAQGQGLVPAAEVSASEINGDGIYHYMNMTLVPGATP